MHVIAFTWVPNTWKTTIITELEKIFSNNWYKVKVYEELSSRIYWLMPNAYNQFKDYTYYQETLYHLESSRLLELSKIIQEQSYDYIFIDRTRYDQYIFYEWLLGNNKCAYIYMKDMNMDIDFYNYVILFNNPITPSSTLYSNDDFISAFNIKIKKRYTRLVQEYYNAIWFLKEKWYKKFIKS